MAAKEIVYSQHARQSIATGLNILANTVKVTLGPRSIAITRSANSTGRSIQTNGTWPRRRSKRATRPR